jgi:hypothetical protein
MTVTRIYQGTLTPVEQGYLDLLDSLGAAAVLVADKTLRPKRKLPVAPPTSLVPERVLQCMRILMTAGEGTTGLDQRGRTLLLLYNLVPPKHALVSTRERLSSVEGRKECVKKWQGKNREHLAKYARERRRKAQQETSTRRQAQEETTASTPSSEPSGGAEVGATSLSSSMLTSSAEE